MPSQLNPSQLSRYIAMAEVVARGRVAKNVQERVEQGQCLIDGCTAEPTRRGLCQRHYQLFRRQLLAQGKRTAQAAFEERQITAGRVLPVGQVRQLRNPSPFE